MQMRSLIPMLMIAVAAHVADAANPEKVDKTGPAGKYLQEAFQAEIDGLPAIRKQRLNAAIQEDPDLRLARWQLGQIERDGEWITFSELPDQLAADDAIAEYRNIRGRYGKTKEAQLELANWCRSAKLPDREKAHLIASLELSDNPNDPELRSRLGFQMVEGEWRTQAEIDELQKVRREYEKHLTYWRPKIQTLVLQLNSRRSGIRKQAIADLKAISEIEALPALEIVLGQAGLEAGRILVEILGQFPSHRAADSLARVAVLSPWKVVRAEASKELRSRPYGAYVPELVGTLRTPIAAEVRLVLGSRGVHLLEQFTRETQTAHQVIDKTRSNYVVAVGQRRFTPRGNSQDDQARLARANLNSTLDARIRAAETQRAVDAENRQTEAWNSRVCEVLASATGNRLPAEPATWWRWWSDYNQMDEGEKETQYRRYEERYVAEVSVRNPTRQATKQSLQNPPSSSSTRRPCECLVAGTPIWTDRGPVPVEAVEIGDLVLAKDPQTGELSYEPVQRTTVRDAEPVMKVVTSFGSIRATGGHTFWISGQGWTKLRDVIPGQQFHGVSGPVEIHSLEDDGEEKTYNLLIPEVHTYFTGEELIMSHDVTVAEPVDPVIPGYNLK